MARLTLTVPALRRVLRAVEQLTADREWCSTNDVADLLGSSKREAIAHLSHLEDLDLVVLLGSSSRYERRWQLTDAGRDALKEPSS